MEDMLRRVIDYGLRLGAGFVDIRIHDYAETLLRVRGDTVESVARNIVRGAAVRVIVNGAMGFTYISRLDEDSLRRAVESAYREARSVRAEEKGFLTLGSRRDTVEDDVRVNPLDVDPGTKARDLLELSRSILGGDERIKSVTVRYRDLVGRKIYVSSEDRFLEQKQSYTWLYIWASGRDGDVAASARYETGTRMGYVLFKKEPVEEIASIVVKRVTQQLTATTPRAGTFPAVLAPEVVGVFVHEAFGHLAEADLAEAGILHGRIGEEIASEHVTIVDDPTVPDAFGTYRYDDEGVEAVKAVIVEKGVLKQYMNDRRHAALLGAKPTGNARAEDYYARPLVRMRTTYMAPGDMRREELFEGIEYGYYIVSFRGGQANLDGTFQVGVQEAYVIRNGEVAEPVRNMSISGNTLETLKTVTGVADDLRIFYGRCGKGQTVYISDGGPHIRVERITVGGRA